MLKETTDLHLQEPAEVVLERSMNFAPDGEWDTKAAREQRIVTFMEQRHYLALARQYGDKDLAQRTVGGRRRNLSHPSLQRPCGRGPSHVRRITNANHFHVRLTNMVRSVDPTSQTVLAHYRQHCATPGRPDALAELILNIMFVRNTMSKEVVTLCKQGQLPWLERDRGKVAEASKKEADQLFLSLGGKVFFSHVEPMRSRSKWSRRGWGELVSELVAFARKAPELAAAWLGENAVETFATAIRKISGFGGKGPAAGELSRLELDSR